MIFSSEENNVTLSLLQITRYMHYILTTVVTVYLHKFSSWLKYTRFLDHIHDLEINLVNYFPHATDDINWN